MNEGYLYVAVYADNIAQPITNAKIEIINLNVSFITDIYGKTSKISLSTSNINNSLSPDKLDPYTVYDILVTKEGMMPVTIKNIQIFDGITSMQTIIMKSEDETKISNSETTIAPNTLNSNYAPKYVQEELTSSTFVLKEVIIPEYIIVHDGNPDDDNAPNYYVRFSDYIKNVASSEIYPTWEKEALKANILAIMSYTLNRVFTEWYLSKGYPFTITSIILYDQKYTHNRTIFESISLIVDELLLKYIKRIDKQEPLFAQYCDGDKTQTANWLWQWGSQDLALQGYNAEEILKYYYGDNLTLETARYEEGLPTSFPGYNLKFGDCSKEVQKIQNELNIIRGNYSGLPIITNTSGEFNNETENAVKEFQKVFSLNITGIVDYATWYKISYLYLAVKRMIFGVTDR